MTTGGMGILVGKMPWNRSRADIGKPVAGGTCAASPASQKEDS